ncbi:Hachiman antiphage defense system protein HamA [Amantichitinum ursilacus]|uniref:Anti-bacteriophage protein A/HamA C-terminal domain-containing protein n=1 Tax=Amantichitinum ursilacus TaxID=857265 RepID=A0A0N0GLL0_9NEIS|nr:Hachiman antiphage defense system protein HamA [Amantichitinum ursilacus]KPC50193.1 hypothetical protein WG78_18350 [Amantichitinum ursilacus]
MTSIPKHCSLLVKQQENLKTSDGKDIEIWCLEQPVDPLLLTEWARHFREHYCLDDEIDVMRDGTGLSRRDYLLELVFPDAKKSPGPSIRSGDFAEILVADYLEYFCQMWVPRFRYRNKSSPNESVKGADVLAFKINAEHTQEIDRLLVYEVKAQLSSTKYNARLQTAIDDSSKDCIRMGYTLNATKQRLKDMKDYAGVAKVARFQNKTDHPYVLESGAVALLSGISYCPEEIQKATQTGEHENQANLSLIVIRGTELMQLVHSLYELAANEA